jgi:cysteine dioxygenase
LNSNENTTAALHTLNDLITALSEGERKSYNHIIHALKIKANAFEKYAFWSDTCYTRNCIVDNEKFELILICWSAGQATQIHDHDGEECWVKVIEGQFKETIYKQNESGDMNVVKTAISKQNDITYMKDFMGFHILENIAQKKSMSLHLYAKPIRKCRIYDVESKIFVDKKLGYDTIASSIIK